MLTSRQLAQKKYYDKNKDMLQFLRTLEKSGYRREQKLRKTAYENRQRELKFKDQLKLFQDYA